MSARNPGRGRQVRRERPFKERHRDTSLDSTRGAGGLRNDSRVDVVKPRKHRDINKADETSSRSRDKNYESAGKLSTTDTKERLKAESGRRPDKGSTIRDKNNVLVQGRDGYRELAKDRRVGNFNDDSPLSVLVRQITRETDSDKRLAAAKKLEEFVNQPANLQVLIKFLDEILVFTEAIFRERNAFDLKDQIAKCVGIISSHLVVEAKGFIFTVIAKVEAASSDDLKSSYVKVLNKAIEQDAKKHRFREFIPLLLQKLQNILENADTSDLLHSVLSVIMPIAVEYSQDFTPYFQDTVDILIGWHIDTSQHDNLIQFTSDCLISLHRYWVADINFSLTLLTQFLEDMDAYSEELKCLAERLLSETDVSPPYSSLPKLTALVRVFTTVMNGIGDCFTPLRSPAITQDYIKKLSKGVIGCVRSGGYAFFYEDLFKTANECFGIMCCFLESQFSSCCEMTAEFALEQLEKKSLTFAHTKSVLTFIRRVVKHVNTSIPWSFLHLILSPDSSIMKLRFCADEEMLRRLMEIFQGLLNIKNVSLVQETYRILVDDIKEAYHLLQDGFENDNDNSEPTTPRHTEITDDDTPPLAAPETKEYENENMSSEIKLYQAQVRIVFDLRAMACLAKPQSPLATLVWKFSPTLLELLTVELNATDWNVACRFPGVQYAVLCSLYDYCKRNNYFLANSGGSADQEEGRILERIQNIILEILEYALASSDIRRLCLAWICDLIELACNSETTATRIKFDSFVESILPLTFLPEQDVRLSASLCIKLMIQRKLPSSDTVKRSFQECIFHITDVNKNVKSVFIQLLMCVPVDLSTSFKLEKSLAPVSKHRRVNADTFCDKPLTLSVNGTWLSRKIHMMKPSTGTFHSHNFRVVSSFILDGVLPAKDVNQDWLVNLFHTCQRVAQKSQTNPMNDKYYFSRRHDPNSVISFSSNYSLLWFWATWELAQFCVLSRLKTPLGRAQETFQAIESVLREYLGQLSPESDNKPIRIKKKAIQEEPVKTIKGPSSQPSSCQLRVKLLLQFVENLDKLMYSAYEGAAVSLPPFPKIMEGELDRKLTKPETKFAQLAMAVRLFFRTNKTTCQEWLSRIRGMVTSVSTECGEPATAVRQGLQLLKEMKDTGKGKERDFEFTVLVVSKALYQLRAPEALQGLLSWCKKQNDRDFPWMHAIVLKSKGRYEKAICEYERCLDVYQKPSGEGQNMESHTHVNPVVLQFLVNEVVDCYTNLTEWSQVEQWQKTIQEMRSRLPNFELQHAANIKMDMNYIRALHKFEDKDFVGVRDCLELIPGASLQFIIDRISGSPLTMEKEETKCGGYTFTPLWSPQQILQASDVNMMQAVTLYWTSGMAGGGTKKDEALRNEINGLLNRATDLLDGVIANGTKNWPPAIPEIHTVQHYGVHILTKILSGKHEEDASHFMPFSNELASKSSRGFLDSAVMCKILQINSYNHYHDNLHGKSQQRSGELLSTLQLATIYSARKEQNFRLAYKLLHEHVNALCKEGQTPIVSLLRGDTGIYSETLRAALCGALKGLEGIEVQVATRSRLYRESAKLIHALGYTSDAAGILCDSIMNCGSREASKSSICNARSLCTLAKWILGDKKILSSNGRSNVSQLSGNLVKVMTYYDVMNKGDSGTGDMRQCIDDVEGMCGRLLSISSQCAPLLDKAWFAFGGWAYRTGRKAVEQACSGGNVDISKQEQETIVNILPEVISVDQKEEILSILSKGQFTTVGAQDEEINSGNELLTREDETVKKQLVSVCPSLSESSIESLVVVWRGICERLFSHYRTAVHAYFKYLKLRGEAPMKDDVDSDSNVTATLRLLRLLVKHAGELQTDLENGFQQTPTRPWEGIIPQLFSRLNHPEEYVRKSVTDLLCRVSKDSPDLILYPAIVGCAGNSLREQNTSNLMTLVASRSDEPDNTFCLDDDVVNLDVGQDHNLQSGYHSIVESLADGNSRLVSEVQEFVQELRRVTLLWEELWLGSLIQIHHDFEKRESQLNDEIKRVNSSSSLSSQEKSTLIRGKHIALMKPIVFALEQLQGITTKQAETPHEGWFQKVYSSVIDNALNTLKNPHDPSKPKKSWAPFRQFLQLLQQRSQKRSSVNLRLEEISPKLCKLNPSFIYMPGQEFFMNKVVTVNSLVNDVVILPTKTRPKKIILVGSDGQKYTYLFKGLEDLHLDERIMQFLSICNNMFAKPNRYEDNVFLARHYSVTPLGPRSGLIQWVDGAVPIFSLYKRWQQRDAAAVVALTKTETGGFTSTPRPPLRPSDLFYNKLTPLLKEKGIDVSSSNRKDWPLSIMRSVLQELLQETPQDLLEKELWCSSTCPSDWWKMSQTFSRSVAVMSMIGYILGLGDRHLDNMLIDFTTGEVVHIDYNICFEKGKGLRVPEKVPFRLTANLETALGVTGVEGTFRNSCEKVLRVLRNGRETLLTLLEAFVYDPLVDWTTGNDNAFANAFYGGRALDPQDVKQTKKDMERTITQCLFSSRVVEMRVSWRANRDDMVQSLINLRTSLDTYFSTISQSLAVDENDKELLDQMDILQSAVKSSSHPLHAVQAKYDEQSRMINELNSVLQNIQDRMKECHQWDGQHRAALENVRGSKLVNIASELVKPLDVGLPSFAPAIGFLQNAGQASTVSQCEQVETELTGLLHKRRSLLRACLDVLHTYATVISQFPAGYSHNSRSYEWQCWLQKITDNPSTEECQRILKDYKCKHSAPITVNEGTALLMNVENKLQNIFNEQKTKFSKFYERRHQEKVETAFLDNAATESFKNLKQFVDDHGEKGKLATIHVMVTALASLHKRCLIMESTARVAESRLLDLVSRDGDWFLEELCSMTGNVIQIATFARTYWMDSLNMRDSCVNNGIMSVQALTSIYHMYKSLQDMMSNFRNIIVPETLKCLEINDPTVLTILTKFEDILLSCDIKVDDLIATLQSYAFKKYEESSDVSRITMMAGDLEKKMMELLSTGNDEILNETGGEPKFQMTAGQMLLAGFNGLFTKLETEVETLLGAVENVDPAFDDGVSVFNEIEKLQVYQNGNHSVLKSLYLLKRMIVMKSFFSDCVRHVKNFTGNSPASHPDYVLSEEQLAVYVRRFIADFVQERMLGLPSFVLAKTIVQWLSLIGLDIVECSKENGNASLEDLCKKAVRQGSFSGPVLSQANSLTGSFDTAWRKHDLARRLDHNMSLYRCVVQRAQLTLARFQWYHEDMLAAAPLRGNTMITPSRSTVRNDLRKKVHSLVSLNAAMSSVQERFTHLESSIEQRLKWAAGANPSLNPILENFEKTLKERKRLVVVESKYSSEISGISNAILHFEAFRTRTNEAMTADQALASLVQKCQESSAKVEKSQDSLKDVQELMGKIQVSSPPAEPITLEWMKNRLSRVKEDLGTNQTQKAQVEKYISNSKEHLRSHVAIMKTAWTAHQVLMGEVKSMLQSLAKDEDAAESSDARTFIITHNKLNEVTTKMLKDIVSTCGSNCGSKSGSESEPAKTSEQQTEILASINSVSTIATWVFDHLPTLASPLVNAESEVKETSSDGAILSFASALRQGSQLVPPAVSKETEQHDERISSPQLLPPVKEALSPITILSPIRQTTGGSAAAAFLRKPSVPTLRDPRTGKAIQERNVYAIGVWKRVKAKLDGRDVDSTKRMSVEDQVDYILGEATSKENLCLMYEGWTPWV